MTEHRVPTHLAILVGVSAGAYAVSLAGVTALQAGTDARLQAQRAPSQQAAESAAAEHDDLEAVLEAAVRRYDALAERYARVGGSLEGMEGALDTLANRAAALSESAASLPTRFSLPTVRSAPRVIAAPKTQATTGASG